MEPEEEKKSAPDDNSLFNAQEHKKTYYSFELTEKQQIISSLKHNNSFLRDNVDFGPMEHGVVE